MPAQLAAEIAELIDDAECYAAAAQALNTTRAYASGWNTVEDLSPSPDGLRIRIARSKTDQHGHGHELLLVYAEPPRPCPVRALRAWLDAAEITGGPIFRRVTARARSPLPSLLRPSH